jgi:hypothetical protein
VPRRRFKDSLKAVKRTNAFLIKIKSVKTMSQKMMMKNALQQPTLFALNMRNVDDLFPGFTAGDFAVVYGSTSIEYLSSLLCIRAQLPSQVGGLNSDVIFIDSGNTFNRQQITHVVQRHHLNQKQALSRIHISRACTAYQMTVLIMEHLKNTINEFNAKLIIISDITGLFLAEDIPEEEARRAYSQVTAYLQKFARENQLIILATCPKHPNSNRNANLQALTCTRANVVLALRQTMYDSEFELEKHPQYMLGIAEFPSQNLTLTDFV